MELLQSASIALFVFLRVLGGDNVYSFYVFEVRRVSCGDAVVSGEAIAAIGVSLNPMDIFSMLRH
jgi:hypothetical protein